MPSYVFASLNVQVYEGSGVPHSVGLPDEAEVGVTVLLKNLPLNNTVVL